MTIVFISVLFSVALFIIAKNGEQLLNFVTGTQLMSIPVLFYSHSGLHFPN